MKTTKAMIEVMQAFEHDKKIEVQDGERKWYGARTPSWNWVNYDYRIKPQPKTIWVNEYGARVCYGHTSKAKAEEYGADPTRTAVEYREVTK